jgi:hypothetical protein
LLGGFTEGMRSFRKETKRKNKKDFSAGEEELVTRETFWIKSNEQDGENYQNSHFDRVGAVEGIRAPQWPKMYTGFGIII